MKAKMSYSPPRISTLRGADIVASLGPASAAGSSSGDAFKANDGSCGYPMGYSCP